MVSCMFELPYNISDKYKNIVYPTRKLRGDEFPKLSKE